MNCCDLESLLLAERDGGLTTAQRASVEEHVASCATCRQARTQLTAALEFMQHEAAHVTVPNIEEEWRTLRAKLSGTEATTSEKKRPLAPVIWFGAPLAAAAALAFAFFSQSPTLAPRPQDPRSETPLEVASAEFVEAGDDDASTMVYVDKDSGWLVVWASDGDQVRSG